MTELWSDHISQEPELVEVMDLGYNVIATQFENANKQFALKSATPEQSWRLQWGSIGEDDINNIFAFYQARSGRFESFFWLHPYEVTTINGGSSGTTITVDQTMRVLVGDTILIGSDVRIVSSVDDANKQIVLTSSVTASDGEAVQLRYSVRFAAELTLETIKAWVYRFGIRFERNL